jgi:hypothetical protein
MDPKLFNFTFKDLAISKEEVVKALHGGEEDESHQYYIDILEQEFLQLNGYSDISGGYIETSEVDFDATNKTIKVSEAEFNVGKIIFNELKPSDKIIVFTCTAGKPLCDYAKEEYKTDVLKGFLIESLANVVVETAMDKIQDKMRGEYRSQNLLVSNRYSPGYCNWNVSEQHKLFKLLPKDFCGVSLTESVLMQPIKSISGFIGVGEKIKYHHYKCKFCTQKQCIYKRKLSKV